MTDEMKFNSYCIDCNEDRLFVSKGNIKLKSNIQRYVEKNAILGDKRYYQCEYVKDTVFPKNKNFEKVFYCSYCDRDKVVFILE